MQSFLNYPLNYWQQLQHVSAGVFHHFAFLYQDFERCYLYEGFSLDIKWKCLVVNSFTEKISKQERKKYPSPKQDQSHLNKMEDALISIPDGTHDSLGSEKSAPLDECVQSLDLKSICFFEVFTTEHLYSCWL